MTKKTETLTAQAVATHNDGILAFVLAKAEAANDDKTPRYPALRLALQKTLKLAKAIVAQTGFPPSGANAGAKDEDVNKPFDVVPFPQGNGTLYALSNPRSEDQDTSLTMAILTAIAVTADDKSTHGWNGSGYSEQPGGGYSILDKKDDDGNPRYARVRAVNKTLNAILEETGITENKSDDGPTTYTLPADWKAEIEKEVPMFPAEALHLPFGKPRKSRLFQALIEIKVKGHPNSKVSIMSGEPLAILRLAEILPKGAAVTVVHVQDPKTLSQHTEAYAKAGLTLRNTDDVKAEIKAQKAKDRRDKKAKSVIPADEAAA